VTIHFVALGLGVAIVNGFCRLPAGVVARPITEMPGLEYHLVHRPGALDRTAVAALRAALLQHATDWRTAPESAWSKR
jgi:DNA-binding transcriptional LysR family regulator